MYVPLSDDKHQMVRDSSKKRTGQCGRNSNPVAYHMPLLYFVCNHLILYYVTSAIMSHLLNTYLIDIATDRIQRPSINFRSFLSPVQLLE